ncbi:F-box domain-containing protein [Aphelenchoides fujianensis]|nr:F-box domain-containing protein [Aphelenchoides fujianensis]
MDTRSQRRAGPRTRAQEKRKDGVKSPIGKKTKVRGAKRSDNKMDTPSTSGHSKMKLRPKKDATTNWLDKFHSMDKKEQLEALESLVSTCQSPQLRHLHALVEPLLQKDFLTLLPREIAGYIVSFLSPKDLMSAGQTCRRWRTLCEDNLLWREKCAEAGVQKDVMPPNLARKQYWEMSELNLLNSRDLGDEMPSGKIVENREIEPDTQNRCFKRCVNKALYLRNQRIRNNWLKNRPTAQCHLPGHDEHVITGLQVNGEMVVTASDDQTVRIWSATSAKVLHTLRGHTGGVWTLLLSEDGSKVISGSTDRTIRVWDAKSGEELHKLEGHTSTVRCMAIHGDTLVTGSRDCSVRVWDLIGGREIKMLMAHYAAVRCVQFDGQRIVSGSYDTKIGVFTVATGKREHLLTGHNNRVYSLLLDGERSLVVSGSLDTTIKVWNIDDGLCLHTLLGHQSLTSGMQLRGNTLVSANADSTIKVWNITDGCCVHTLAGPHRHTSAVTSLQFLYDDVIVTSSDDGTVKMWDITTGKWTASAAIRLFDLSGTFISNLVQLSTQRAGGCVWRLKTTPTSLIAAVGSRNGSEDTKLIMLDFETAYP